MMASFTQQFHRQLILNKERRDPRGRFRITNNQSGPGPDLYIQLEKSDSRLSAFFARSRTLQSARVIYTAGALNSDHQEQFLNEDDVERVLF